MHGVTIKTGMCICRAPNTDINTDTLPKHVISPLAPCLTHTCQTGGLLLLTTLIINDCNLNLKQYMTCTCYNRQHTLPSISFS